VVLVYETSGLRVETQGIAEENGRTGELIQVKNPASGKLLRGRVLDGRLVRIN
jgi:flagellar basal body P-ring formation protein FlgA